MATGPLILPITAGSALSMTEVVANFAAIQAFLASLPVDNLNVYKANHALHGYADAVLTATTRRFGYTVIEGGTFASEPVKFIVGLRRAVVIAANTIVVTVQKSSTDITGATASAAAWTTLGTITFTATNTAVGYRNDQDAAATDYWYVQSAALSGVQLEDAYALRFAIVDGGTGATSTEVWATLWCKLRLRG